jgi:hypothetical protein
MAQRIAGIAFLSVNGNPLALRGNFTVSPTRLERAGIAGQDFVHGFSELPRVPFIQGDVSLMPDMSVEDLDDIDNGTVVAQLANGKNYVLSEAWRAATSELNTREGLTPVRFEGVACEEF